MSDGAAGAPIVMPKLGLTMSEGLIAEWHVRAGDAVRAGQILFVVETDKISNEIEAPADGTIVTLLAEEGATVAVGVPVATWTGPAQGMVREAVVADSAPTIVLPTTAPVRPSASERRLSTPFARRLAQQGNIDIALLTGTGAHGRVRARDVEAALAERPGVPSVRDKAVGGPTRNLRSLIAARVLRSKAEVPHFYVTADARFDALAALRRDLNDDPLAPRKLSVTAFLGVAVARALESRPEANVVWREQRLVSVPCIAIGIAVETPGGVMAPVVPAEGGLYAFAAALDAAVARARDGRLGAADVGEAVIGISNVGMVNVRSLTPIIDPDQTFMLGVGAPQAVFRPDDHGRPVAVQEVTLSLACDHRAIDGAGAARFLATIVELIEHPARLLISR